MLTARNELKLGEDMVPIQYTAGPLNEADGNVTGGVVYIVDVRKKLQAQAKIRQQHNDLLRLSVPVLELRKGVLALLLLEPLDSRRIEDATEKALTRMANEHAQVLIVDVAGVPTVDTMVANHIIRMVAEVRLIGEECILTGVSPTTAKSMVHLGSDPSGLKTRPTLAQGLNLAIELTSNQKRM